MCKKWARNVCSKENEKKRENNKRKIGYFVFEMVCAAFAYLHLSLFCFAMCIVFFVLLVCVVSYVLF